MSTDAQLDHLAVGYEYLLPGYPHVWGENCQTRPAPHHQAGQEGSTRHMAHHEPPEHRGHS